MAFKLTMFFSLGRRAWSEAYLNPASVINSSVSAAVFRLINARAALLGNDAQLFAARLSSFPANGIVEDLDARLFVPGGHYLGGSEAVSLRDSDQANSAMLCKASGPLGQKLIYVGGIPDGVIDDSTTPPPGLNFQLVAGFTDAFNAFQTELTTSGWGYRTWKTSVRVQALGLQQGTQSPPLIGVQFAAAQAFQVNEQVLLSGWRRKNPYSPGLSGVFKIAGIPPAAQVAPPFVYYLQRTERVDPNNFKSVGSLAATVFTIAAIQQLAPNRACTRKRGGRLLLPLGRSSKNR